ncbi:MAG: TIGR02300 family protein [Acetobacteraceae bacterium]|nr:TIGR02300 family protein [Acetobacteraceae bacterium]MSP30634.1 TIGR02300 family protein [Acetobacteraceae bacterium]
MSKPEFGTKRACVGCAARFYDMARSPPTCPKCGAVQPPDVPRPRYGGRSLAGPRRSPWQATPVAAVEEAEPAADVVEDDEDEVIQDDEDGELDAEVPPRPTTLE